MLQAPRSKQQLLSILLLERYLSFYLLYINIEMGKNKC